MAVELPEIQSKEILPLIKRPLSNLASGYDQDGTDQDQTSYQTKMQKLREKQNIKRAQQLITLARTPVDLSEIQRKKPPPRKPLSPLKTLSKKAPLLPLENFSVQQPSQDFYAKVRQYYDIELCDASKHEAEKLDERKDFYEKSKDEAIEVLKHSYKWKNEMQRLSMKLGTDEYGQSLILRQERQSIMDKIECIRIILAIAEQRLNWIIDGNQIKREDLEKIIQQTHGSQKSQTPKFQKSAPFSEAVEKSSREARQLLDLEISDARSLKNRLRAGTIREILTLYWDFEQANQTDRLPVVIKDCLLTQHRTDKFFKLITNIAKNSEIPQVPEHLQFEKKVGQEQDKFDNNLEFIAGKNALQLILSNWHLNINDEQFGEWPLNEIFGRIQLMQNDIRDISEYTTAFTFGQLYDMKARNYQNKNLFSQEDLDYLLNLSGITRKQVKNLELLVNAIAEQVDHIPESILDLAKGPSLKELEIHDQDCSFLNEKVFASILHTVKKHHNNLLSIDLSNSNIDSLLGNQLGIILGSKKLKNLVHLNLNDNDLTDSWIDLFKFSYTKRKDFKLDQQQLEGLQLAYNDLTIYSITQISSLINSNKLPLKILNLRGNKLRDKGIESLYLGLIGCQTIQFLDLSFCKMTDIGFSKVVDFVKMSNSLKVLYLLGNRFTGKGLEYLEICWQNDLSHSQLQILKIGEVVDCTPQLLREIFFDCKSIFLRYIHIHIPFATGVSKIDFKNVQNAINGNFQSPLFAKFFGIYDEKSHDTQELTNFFVQVMIIQKTESIQQVYRYCESIIKDLVHNHQTQNSIEVIQFILSEFIKPWEIKMSNKLTLFHYFVKKGLIDEIALCLNSAVDNDIRDDPRDRKGAQGFTALMYACKLGHSEIVQLLIDQGSDLNKQDIKGNTALHFAVQHDSIDLIRNVFKGQLQLMKFNNQNFLPLHSSIKIDSLQIFRYMVKKYRAFFKLKNDEDQNVLELKTRDNKTPLMICVIQGNKAIFEYLMRPKSYVELDSVDDYGKRAIDYAVENQRESFVIALVETGASLYLKNEQDSILLQVVKRGMFEASKALIKKGANAKIKDKLENNLLHFAVSSENEKLVRYLVNLGVYTKHQNSIGKIPLDYALTDSMRVLVLRDNMNQKDSPTKIDRNLRKTQGDIKIHGLGKVRSVKNIPLSEYNNNKDMSNLPKHGRNRKQLKEEEKYDSNDSQLTITTPTGSSQDDQSSSESEKQQNPLDPGIKKPQVKFKNTKNKKDKSVTTQFNFSSDQSQQQQARKSKTKKQKMQDDIDNDKDRSSSDNASSNDRRKENQQVYPRKGHKISVGRVSQEARNQRRLEKQALQASGVIPLKSKVKPSNVHQ